MFVFANLYADERTSTKIRFMTPTTTSTNASYLSAVLVSTMFAYMSRAGPPVVDFLAVLSECPEILFILACQEKLAAVGHSCGVDNDVL